MIADIVKDQASVVPIGKHTGESGKRKMGWLKVELFVWLVIGLVFTCGHVGIFGAETSSGKSDASFSLNRDSWLPVQNHVHAIQYTDSAAKQDIALLVSHSVQKPSTR